MTGRRLLLLRHGRTAWNDVGRAQGHHDVELDEVGHAQAAAVAPQLAELGPAALWTSDLSRARQTCGYLERATGLTATVDARLREFDVGARQGLTPAEFETTFPEAYAAWSAGDDMVAVPGSELAADVAERLVPALEEALASLADGATGVMVTHGACMKVGVLGLLGWPQQQGSGLRGVGNCAWTVLSEAASDGRLRLEAWNRGDTASGKGTVDL